jgi:hypothetical protein
MLLWLAGGGCDNTAQRSGSCASHEFENDGSRARILPGRLPRALARTRSVRIVRDRCAMRVRSPLEPRPSESDRATVRLRSQMIPSYISVSNDPALVDSGPLGGAPMQTRQIELPWNCRWMRS